MGAHLIGGEFQSDKYPECPRGKVPLSVKDVTAKIFCGNTPNVADLSMPSSPTISSWP